MDNEVACSWIVGILIGLLIIYLGHRIEKKTDWGPYDQSEPTNLSSESRIITIIGTICLIALMFGSFCF